MIGRIIANKFKITEEFSSGSFSKIYKGINIQSNNKVIFKVESLQSPYPQLSFESKLYSLIKGSINVPNTYCITRDNYNTFLIMEELGMNLEELFVHCGQRFSAKTVLMLTDQMLSSIEFIHKKGFIHNDIKPDNFVLGLDNKKNQIYLIDYGLSKRYIDPSTKKHVPYQDKRPLTGTPRYSSINALKGIRQTRRDDLESLAYVWIYLMKGYLPWMGINARSTKEKHSMILEAKSGVSLEKLCENLPDEFLIYLKEVRELKFDEEPDYAKYRKMFRDAFLKYKLKFDYHYDWVDERGNFVSKSKKYNIPLFRKYESQHQKKLSNNMYSRKQMFLEIKKESKRDALMQSDYDDEDEDDMRSCEDQILMDDSDGPATYEAVNFEEQEEKDQKEYNDQTMKLIKFDYKKSTTTWKNKEVVDQRKQPFRLPEEREIPRWMRTRELYDHI